MAVSLTSIWLVCSRHLSRNPLGVTDGRVLVVLTKTMTMTELVLLPQMLPPQNLSQRLVQVQDPEADQKVRVIIHCRPQNITMRKRKTNTTKCGLSGTLGMVVVLRLCH